MQSNGDPTLLLITPDDTYLLDISTCNPGTTTHTVRLRWASLRSTAGHCCGRQQA